MNCVFTCPCHLILLNSFNFNCNLTISWFLISLDFESIEVFVKTAFILILPMTLSYFYSNPNQSLHSDLFISILYAVQVAPLQLPLPSNPGRSCSSFYDRRQCSPESAVTRATATNFGRCIGFHSWPCTLVIHFFFLNLYLAFTVIYGSKLV